MIRDPGDGVGTLVAFDSRCLLTHLRKALPLLPGQELETPCDGMQQRFRVPVIQICSRQEVRADHFQSKHCDEDQL